MPGRNPKPKTQKRKEKRCTRELDSATPRPLPLCPPAVPARHAGHSGWREASCVLALETLASLLVLRPEDDELAGHAARPPLG